MINQERSNTIPVQKSKFESGRVIRLAPLALGLGFGLIGAPKQPDLSQINADNYLSFLSSKSGAEYQLKSEILTHGEVEGNFLKVLSRHLGIKLEELYVDGRINVIDNRQKLDEAVLPIASPHEAVAYAMALSQQQLLTEFSGNKARLVAQSGDYFLLQMWQTPRFDCDPRPVEKVELAVFKETGQIFQISAGNAGILDRGWCD